MGMEKLWHSAHSHSGKKISGTSSAISFLMVAHHQQVIPWHTTILPRATEQALEYLAGQSWLKRSGWYLAGGTALALQTGHRSSVDLDFFTRKTDFSSGRLISRFGVGTQTWTTDVIREGTVYGRLGAAKVSFIAYPFFLPKRPYHWYGSVPVLDARDIAVMKIIAISQRGRKRDFVDLYWYCVNREALVDVLLRVSVQYPTVAHDFHHIIKSFTYFIDAEADPMPRIFFSATWPKIKAFFRREAVAAARHFLAV